MPSSGIYIFSLCSVSIPGPGVPRPAGCWGGSALALFHQIQTLQLLLPAQGWAEAVAGAVDGGRC